MVLSGAFTAKYLTTNSSQFHRGSLAALVHFAGPFDMTETVGLCFTIMSTSWTELLVTYDSLEAEMVKDLLESGGIEVTIRSSKVTPYPVNIGRMGEVKVFVREEDKEAAEAMIRSAERGREE
jgi:hypothetical protein